MLVDICPIHITKKDPIDEAAPPQAMHAQAAAMMSLKMMPVTQACSRQLCQI